MITIRIILSLALGVTALYTVFAYPNHYGALTPRSRLYRTAGLFLLNLLIALCLLMTMLDFGEGHLGKIRAATYGLACICLAFVVLCIALLDSVEAYVLFRRERRKNLEQMFQEELERLQKDKESKSDKRDIPKL